MLQLQPNDVVLGRDALASLERFQPEVGRDLALPALSAAVVGVIICRCFRRLPGLLVNQCRFGCRRVWRVSFSAFSASSARHVRRRPRRAFGGGPRARDDPSALTCGRTWDGNQQPHPRLMGPEGAEEPLLASNASAVPRQGKMWPGLGLDELMQQFNIRHMRCSWNTLAYLWHAFFIHRSRCAMTCMQLAPVCPKLPVEAASAILSRTSSGNRRLLVLAACKSDPPRPRR